ncbi:rod shape-determining protein MreD [Ornithobacterium rhinotracheale]|uniref:rod shape-determining protein MreD n=1 Tax=Ornithobacterium rhinotracheale TaxID=28251 RepID=UPI00403579F1
MVQSSLANVGKMIFFILLQVLIFNNINFWGYANPYIYILFILTLPSSTNRYALLLYAFTIGFAIDVFEHTGGVNAFATVLVAYLRNPLINLLSNQNVDELGTSKFANFSFLQWSVYIVVLILIQHLSIDLIESLQWHNFWLIVERSLIGTLISIILSAIYILSFPPKRQSEI